MLKAASVAAGEVREVRGHDHLGAGLDGCRKHMPIIGIGQRQAIDQGLEAAHDAVRDGFGHELPRTSESFRPQIRPALEDGAKALVQDGLGPSSTNQPGSAEPNEQVTKRRWVQHAGVVEDDEGHAQYPSPSFSASAVSSSWTALRRASSLSL